MKLSAFASAGALAAVLLLANNASAATVLGYDLESGVFGDQLGVHSTNSQTGVTTANAFVNQDGSAVTFTSTGAFSLQVNGQGEATIVGDPILSNLTVTFAKTWGAVTFDLESDTDSTMSLLVNGVALFSTGGACGTLCDLSASGSNKFILSGPAIQTLTFNFDPTIADAKQFRLQVPGGQIPEPASWAMMLVGVGAIGGALRMRRKTALATA